MFFKKLTTLLMPAMLVALTNPLFGLDAQDILATMDFSSNPSELATFDGVYQDKDLYATQDHPFKLGLITVLGSLARNPGPFVSQGADNTFVFDSQTLAKLGELKSELEQKKEIGTVARPVDLLFVEAYGQYLSQAALHALAQLASTDPADDALAVTYGPAAALEIAKTAYALNLFKDKEKASELLLQISIPKCPRGILALSCLMDICVRYSNLAAFLATDTTLKKGEDLLVEFDDAFTNSNGKDLNPFLTNLIKFQINTSITSLSIDKTFGRGEDWSFGIDPRRTVELAKENQDIAAQISAIKERINQNIGQDSFWSRFKSATNDHIDYYNQPQTTEPKDARTDQDDQDEQEKNEDIAKALEAPKPPSQKQIMLDTIHRHLVLSAASTFSYNIGRMNRDPELKEHIEAGYLEAKLYNDVFQSKLSGFEGQKTEDGHDLEKAFEETARMTLSMLTKSHLANQAMHLYMHGVSSQNDAGQLLFATDADFLKYIQSESKKPVKEMAFNIEAAFLTLNIYSTTHFRLPHRKQWAEALNTIAERIHKENDQDLKASLVYFDSQNIIAYLGPCLADYMHGEELISNFLTTLQLPQLAHPSAEEYLSKNLGSFHSFFYEFQRINNLHQKINALLEIDLELWQAQEKRSRFYEQKLEPIETLYYQLNLQLACYAYWLPINEKGQWIEQFQNDTLGAFIDTKPASAKVYRFPLTDAKELKSINLTQACGTGLENVSMSVNRYIYNIKSNGMEVDFFPNLTKILWSHGFDLIYTLGTVKLVNLKFAENWVSALAKWSSTKSTQALVRWKAFHFLGHRFALGRLGLTAQRLRYFNLRSGYHSINTGTRALAFITANHTLRYFAYLASQSSGWIIPGHYMVQGKNPESFTEHLNEYVKGLLGSVERDYAMSLAIFAAMPIVSHVASKQVYMQSLKSAGIRDPFVLKKLTTRNHINDYFKMHGTKRWLVNKQGHIEFMPTNQLMAHSEFMAFQSAYTLSQTALFTSTPYIDRFVTPYFDKAVAYMTGRNIFSTRDDVWQGWTTFQTDIAGALFTAKVFTRMGTGKVRVKNGFDKVYAKIQRSNRPHEVLNVPKGASPEQIRTAYQTRSAKASYDFQAELDQAYHRLLKLAEKRRIPPN